VFGRPATQDDRYALFLRRSDRLTKKATDMIALDRPIPILEHALTSASYHDIPIEFQDPRYQEILVDARESGVAGENYYSRTDGQNPPYRKPIKGAIRELWCRQTVVTMLTKVNESLAVHGAELYLFDAYRPIACQQGLWDFFWAQARQDMPHADVQRIFKHVQQYVSDPRHFDPENPRTWPIHTTGAAVDLTLRDLKSGDLLDMGADFDQMRPASHSAHFERLLNDGLISSDCVWIRNRRLLYWAMCDNGFTNYSYEFWHFDFGDQMHIMSLKQLGKDAHAAWYGFVSPSTLRT
jgi:D-alanyl-D-alanine dipeptidase